MSAMSAVKRLPLYLLFLLILCSSSLALAGDRSGYLGVQLQDLSPGLVKALQLGDKSGVLISEVVEDSPAEAAGLEDGDVILVFDGTKTKNAKMLTKAVRQAEPGEDVKVVVLREGKEKTIKVELGEREEYAGAWSTDQFKKLQKLDELGHPRAFKWIDDEDGHIEIITDGDLEDIHIDRGAGFFGGDHGFLGISLDDLNGQLGEYFGVEDGDGVLVTEVVEDGPAEKAGIRAGDVITGIDGKEVPSSRKLRKVMAGTEAEQKVKVEVSRKGDRKEFEVTLGEAPRTKIRLPRTLHKENFHGKDRTFHVYPEDDEEGRIVIKRHQHEIQEMREEMEQLKQELKKMQQELQK